MRDEAIGSLLEEYNQKIGALESSKHDPEELLEAYVNRGSILVMMESYVSALSDFEEAADMIIEMGPSGMNVDDGTFVKTYFNIGRMSDPGEMEEAYSNVASRLNGLSVDSRHYDTEHIVHMCLMCAEDLFDAGSERMAEPFLEKTIQIIGTKTDAWSRNRLAEAYGLLGQIEQLSNKEKSIFYFSKAIEIAKSLYSIEELDDPMELALALVSLGDIYESKGLLEDAVSLHVHASEVLEIMNYEGSIEDTELLAGLYSGIASMLFSLDRDAEAEKYMVRAARAEAESDQ